MPSDRSKHSKRTSLSMSVFGAAPSLQNMKFINGKTGGNEILFRGATFWYRFRLMFPILAPVSFVFALVIALTCWNTVAGHMFMGGMLSLVSSVLVCMSYIMIVPWRKHPSTMVFYRAAADVLFSFVVVLMAIEYHLDSGKGCRGYPVFTQFFLIAGECWLTTIALDLVFSLTNPFTSYKGNMRRYHFMVWTFTILITFAFDTNTECQARVEQGICWIRISSAMDPCLWGYYFIWIIGMYGFQLGAIVFASQRLKKGLPATFEIRKKCASETFKCLRQYGAYLLILCLFFILLVSSNSDTQSSNEGWSTVSKVFLFVISSRGFVDSLVWFNLHDFAREDTRRSSQVTKSQRISHSATVIIGDEEDGSGAVPTKRLDSFGIADTCSSDSLDDPSAEIAVDFDETALSPQVGRVYIYVRVYVWERVVSCIMGIWCRFLCITDVVIFYCLCDCVCVYLTRTGTGVDGWGR